MSSVRKNIEWANQRRVERSAEVAAGWRGPSIRVTKIYFIQADNGKVKIGIAENVENRLANLQSSSPCMLNLLFADYGDRSTELTLHRRFAHAHSHGEWFNPSADLMQFISDIKGRAVRP